MSGARRVSAIARLVPAFAAMTLVTSACGGSDVTAPEVAVAQPQQGVVGGTQADVPEVAPPGAGAADVPAPALAADPAPAAAPAAEAEDSSAAAGVAASEAAQPGAGAKQGGKAAKRKTAANDGDAGDGGAAATADRSGKVALSGLAAGAARLVETSPLFGGKGVCKPATLSEIKVGNLSTLSGVLGELFAPVVPALETWAAATNACGGLGGHKINLIIRDDQGDPSTAISAAQQMIDKDKIFAFVGNIQLLTIQAVLPAIEKAGIPVVGGDLTSDTWFTEPLLFPQGSSVQSFAVAYLEAVKTHFGKKVAANVWCIEVPRSCGAQNRALREMAPELGIDLALSPQVSITQPSYVQECLQMKNAGIEAVLLSIDAASAVRLARSCEQVGFFPETLIHPVGIGNEKQYFGNKWLGGTYVPLNTFPHMADNTPATRYYQDSVRKFNPGFDTGGAASSGWTAGALLAAAAANLPAQNPTTKDLLDTLYEFQGQDFTHLGGLTATNLHYERGGIPRVQYCHYNSITNEANDGWSSYTSKPVCSDLLAPSDPQSQTR